MTKETKIGLLVGLAFIILFAIILSENGPTHRGTAPPAFTLVDAHKQPPTGIAGQPLRDAGKLPVESQLGPIVKRTTPALPPAPMKEEQIAEAPREEETIVPLPDTLAGLLKSQPNEFVPANPPRATPEPALARADLKPSIPTIKVPASAEHSETESGVETSDALAFEQAEKEVQRAQTTDPKSVILAQHTVAPGESLGKIAAKYYGRATPARVDALYKTNRDALPNISSVRAGDKLLIPDLGVHNDSFEPAPNFLMTQLSDEGRPTKDQPVRIPPPVREKKLADSSTAKADPVKSLTYEWYEVRKNDTLSKIARRELGSEKFVKDLYRLNRDKLNDKHTLKPGTKIRVPSKAVMNPEPTAALTASGLDEP